jgi:hypothetical protein
VIETSVVSEDRIHKNQGTLFPLRRAKYREQFRLLIGREKTGCHRIKGETKFLPDAKCFPDIVLRIQNLEFSVVERVGN